MKFQLTSLLIFILMVSCSGETRTSRDIKNDSDKSLKMVIYRHGFSTDSLSFAPGQSRQISISTENSGTDEAPDCINDIDSAHTVIEGGGLLTKDISLSENWTSETEKTKSLPPEYENSCVFRIANSDIE